MILFIDDNVDELRMLKLSLQSSLPDLFIYWVPYLQTAKQLLSVQLYLFDMVLTDVSGVTLGNFAEEVKELKHSNIVVTSSVLIPINMKIGYNFVLKENLVSHLKTFYAK